ncbi:MAG TPA: DinB family protein [Thermoanaerobaculia bacterium]|nr:DinB family protein [Thermoanaerobaculia bacterium]
MKMTELFLGELEREAKPTRRTLEQVPDGLIDWRPHPRSMPLGYLATLVATLPSWIALMVNQPELDLRPVDREPFRPPTRSTAAEYVAALDESVQQARQALSATTDEHLLTHWQLKAAGHVVTDQPRHIFIRDAVFNHLAHHRGQLTVYLRLNEAKVPSIYGPTADEPM